MGGIVIHLLVKQDKMAKGAGKGGAKSYACGNKGCYIGILVVGVVLLIVGIVLIAMAADAHGDKKDTSTMSSSDQFTCNANHAVNDGNVCDNCYDDDNGKSILDTCCTKSVDCGDLAAEWGAGVALAIVGAIVFGIATCGVCMCCCFGKETGAPPVALTGSPPVAIEA